MFNVNKIGLIAGGTGVTPMLQLIQAVASDPEDHTELHLIFANKTAEDIFLRRELESYQSPKFRLWYTIDEASPGWAYSVGHVNSDMIRSHLPTVNSDVYYFVCGPGPMIRYACEPAFAELGIPDDQWTSF